jgi:hypothetical protein
MFTVKCVISVVRSFGPRVDALYQAWENTGNFIDSCLENAATVTKNAIRSVSYEPIPYASKQGIFAA